MNHDKFIYPSQPNTTTHVIINQLQIPIQNINQQISNNIEITNNINTGDLMMTSSVQNDGQRQNSLPRSFSIVQKFKIQPLFNENNQAQFLDIKISNQQQKHNTYRKEVTKKDSTDVLNISSSRTHKVKKPRDLLSAQNTFKSQIYDSFKKGGEDFAPLGYDELSDYDIDSDEDKKRKSKKIPPSPINLNQLYLNDAQQKRSIQKRGSRKSSINLQNNQDQNQSRQSIRIENDTKRQSSLLLGVSELDHKASLKSSQLSINNKQEHRSPMTKIINIDYLDTHQPIKNGLTPIEERNSPTISNHNFDEEHSNPATTRQFLGVTEDQLILPENKDKEVNDKFLNELQKEPEADFEVIREKDHNSPHKDEDLEIKENENTAIPQEKVAESQMTSGTEKSASDMKSLRKNERFLDDICVDDAARLRSIKKYDYFIILPDDSFKQRWDLIITICLLFTAIMTPYRISFYDLDDNTWIVIDSLVDSLFGIDIFLNFYMAYYDESEDIVDVRKKIACRYIKRWFMVDLVSIFPISQIMNTDDYSSLARIARLPKLYRLIKVFRLVRLMKVVKERNTLIKQVNDLFKISAGFERLIFFIIMSTVVCHICGCFWYGYQDSTNFEVYIASMYFTLTTITTVGFGDITGFTAPERIMCIILMIIGVFSFSFSISSLSSMLSSMDSRNANLHEKLSTLNKIKKDYRIGFEFYRRLKMALKYDYQKNGAAQFSLVNELPQNLKIELSLIMHKEIVKKIYFFQNKPPHFIAFIGPLLKPLHVEIGNYIYKEKDPIEEIFFLTNGKAALVHKDLKDSAYLIIDQGYYFGEIDFVFQNNDGKRRFTVKALDNCHLLTISKGDLGKVDVEYEEILQDLFNNAQKRLKRTLKIKDESESYFLKKQIQNQRLSVGQDDSAIRRMSTAFLNVKDKKKKQESSENHLGVPSFDSSNVFGDGLSINKEIKELNQIDEEDDEEDDEEGDDEEDDIKTDSTFLEQEKEMIQHQKEAEEKEQELYQLHRYQNDQRDVSQIEDSSNDNDDKKDKSENKSRENDNELIDKDNQISQQDKNKIADPSGSLNNQSLQLKKNQDPQDQEDTHQINRKSDDSPFPQGSIDQLSFSSFDGNNDNNEDWQQQYNSNNPLLKDGNNSSSKMVIQSLGKPQINKKKTSDPMINTKRKFSMIQSLLTMPNQELIKNLQEGIRNKQMIPMRNMTDFDLNQLKRESATEERETKKIIEQHTHAQEHKKKKNKDKKKKLMIMRSRTNFNDDNHPIPIKKKTKTKNKDNDNSLQTPQINKMESSMGESQIQSHEKDDKDKQSKNQQQYSNKSPIQENIEEDKQSQEEVIPTFNQSENISSPVKDQTQITTSKITESISNTNINQASAKVSPVIPTLKLFQNNVQSIQVEASTNSKPNTTLLSKNTQFEHLQSQQLVPPNFNAKQRKSVMLNPGQSGTLLDKLRQNSQRNLMNSLKKNVNSIIIENQFKRAILGDRSPSPLLSQKKPFGGSDVQSEAQQQNQKNLISQIEKDSKEMFESMNQRINKIEESVFGIEQSLQVLIQIQANQGQNQEQQQLVSFIMGAINEIHQENENNLQQRNNNGQQQQEPQQEK